ncbi:MAG: hypothetical protein JNM24_11155 [Bdellovibrionaceae bacterium]|nr:hypothetical protein [Pseudobdellovibrionaceae bacterium]
MRQKQIRNLFLFSLSFLILALFFKPYHSHSFSHSTGSASTSDHHSDVEHSEDAQSDCGGNECACPQHRVNGCGPFAAVAKNNRIDLLEVSSPFEIETSFSAKQSPILDGPFQPPRA